MARWVLRSGATGAAVVLGLMLATGTASGVGYARTPPWLLQPGDVVEVEVERLGVVRNPIVGNEARRDAVR